MKRNKVDYLQFFANIYDDAKDYPLFRCTIFAQIQYLHPIIITFIAQNLAKNRKNTKLQ